MKKSSIMHLIAPDHELARTIAAAPATRGVARTVLPETAPRRTAQSALASAATGAVRVMTEALRIPALTGPQSAPHGA